MQGSIGHLTSSCYSYSPVTQCETRIASGWRLLHLLQETHPTVLNHVQFYSLKNIQKTFECQDLCFTLDKCLVGSYQQSEQDVICCEGE